MDETELVERLAAIGWKGSRGVILGPGDDAAVLRGGLAVSTDMMVEGVHFSFDWVTPTEAGFRAGAAALSDMAAMGASPEALLVSMALPAGDPELGEALQRGVRAAGDRVGAVIAGGDVSRTPRAVVLDVVVVGRVRDGGVRRSGAQPGDDLWVSGVVGGAAAAVAAWSQGREPAPAARVRFAAPPDRTGLGRALAAQGLASAMIDISDGLVLDAKRLAKASSVAIRVRRDLVPVDTEAGGDLNRALEGGEDYELMFTAHPKGKERVLALERELSVQLTRIGTVGQGADVALEDSEGRQVRPGRGGYDHFADPSGNRG
ncbi:MAG: thiamine-phosphate kinase [Gemmatimonadetes bacterium]|nr:thiamine-phosphate kinase [Gemmatimonadota bacterium]